MTNQNGWWPAPDNVMLTDDIERMPPEQVTRDDSGVCRDNDGELFRGWFWRGLDGNYYGQRRQTHG